ncbi:MAG TPA: hypothetical protein VGF69_19365 [Thermoanaerobaculia bacterium]|jgi:hypothetical protein
MKRAGVALALLLIAAGAFEPFYFRIFTIGRAQLHASMTSLPYRKTAGLREFYLDVRRWTKPGERIAIFPTFTHWTGGYAYLYERALYPLAGRNAVALVEPDDRARPDLLARVDAIAAWHAAPPVPGFAVAERKEHGVLLRRIR